MDESKRLRKVAILVDSLDARRADALLDQLSQVDQELVRNRVMDLGHVSDAEREAIISEFLGPKDGRTLPESEFSGEADPSARDRGSGPGEAKSLQDGEQVETQRQAHSPSPHDYPTPFDDVPGIELQLSDAVRQDVDEFRSLTDSAPVDPELATIGSAPHATDVVATESADNDVDRTPDSFRAHQADSLDGVHRRAASPHQPFGYLRDEDVPRLARHLEYENPQIIAQVVSTLDPDLAAVLLARMTPSVQANVLQRLPELDSIDAEILHEIDRYFLARLTQSTDGGAFDPSSPGVKSLEAILSAATDRERASMVASLRANQPTLSLYFERKYGLSLSDHAECSLEQGYERLHHGEQLSRPHELRNDDWVPADGSDFSNAANDRTDDTVNHAWDESAERSQSTFEAEAKELEFDSDFPSPNSADFDVGTTEPIDDSLDPFGDKDVDDNLSDLTAAEFDALLQLDSASFATVIGHADPEVVLVALAGARPQLIRKLLKQVPRKESRAVKRRIEQIGPIRVADIRKAQRELVRLAQELSESGHVRKRKAFFRRQAA